MSNRAIQRLRRERQGEILPSVADGDESDEDSDDDEPRMVKKSNVFASAMFDDDSDEDSEDDSEDDSDNDSDDDSDADPDDGDDPDVDSSPNKKQDSSVVARTDKDKKGQTSDTEDLDTLLQEYKLQDAEQEEQTTSNDDNQALSQYSVITSRMEIRDLDIESVRRSFFGGAEVNDGESGTSSRRTHRHNYNLFGTPSENWPRPPHYVGGGIGFKAYTDSQETLSQPLPWPYCDMKEGDSRCPPLRNWFQFIHSDSYQRDYKDMQTIQDSGDPNAMLLFIAHHPFVVEALLQISIVMYQMNQSNEGLSFLKRALWIFECAAPKSFKAKDRCAFMDFQKGGNKAFFSTLFRLIRVSYVGGLTRTAFAVSQFLLSLDPLRDPMNILLSIDHFANVCNTDSSKRWVVDFVESKKVYVAFRDDEAEEFECQILDLPNWGYSYALSLFNLHDDAIESDEFTKEKANNALKAALRQFPSVIRQLLAKNEVGTSGRSLRTDWPAAFKYLDELDTEFQTRLHEAYRSDTVTRARISQAYGTIVQIFVRQNYKLWASSDVLTWIYDNLMALQKETKNAECTNVKPLSPALTRYINSDPVDYEDKFQTMPADANPFDPNIIALALNVDPNRRRLVQRNPRRAGANLMDENGAALATRDGNFLGPATEIIDPDLPLLEVFWRSALPWAHVEGVPPPNR